MSHLLMLPYKYIVITNSKLLSHIWCPYMDTKVNISALRCNNCNIEKVDIGELLRVVDTDWCPSGDLCCVTCQPGSSRPNYILGEGCKGTLSLLPLESYLGFEGTSSSKKTLVN